ncbi:hypothetical protein K435DRAFT_688499, partial [Dendrothele bispora CBS 962.96]
VNRACEDVIQKITDTSLAEDDSPDYVPGVSWQQIRSSTVRRSFFSDCVQSIMQKDLQLLRDVDTRWSSVLYMIDRAILLKEAIQRILNSNEFPELKNYSLTEENWGLLHKYSQILQVPHAFQERLSAEKTPTLSYALPTFEAMTSKWRKLQETSLPEYDNIIRAGIEKLDKYRDRAEQSDAHTLAMRKIFISLFLLC